jgi:hypothetical protein
MSGAAWSGPYRVYKLVDKELTPLGRFGFPIVPKVDQFVAIEDGGNRFVYNIVSIKPADAPRGQMGEITVVPAPHISDEDAASVIDSTSIELR